MILADTSAWVEYDRATGSSADLRIKQLIEAGGSSVAVTEPVVMEVIAGARDDPRETELRRMLASAKLLPFDAVSDFNAAARIYRRCRANGVTPRGMLDCAIVAVAWRGGATLLAHDVDIDRVAGVIGVELDDASLRAGRGR